MRRTCLLLCVIAASLTASHPVSAADLPEKVTYDDHIKPILRERCFACHDQDGRSADLALDSYAALMEGGASGEVVSGGAADASRLWKVISHAEEPMMPPDEDRMPDAQLALVKAWIDGGLLENAGSKAIKRKASAVAEFTPSADNRPEGEPAMPSGWHREPVLHTPRAGAVGTLAASPWAPLVAVGGQRQVLLYHAATHELLGVVPFVVGNPQVIRFSRNGDLLLVAGGHGASLGVADLWDIKKGERLARLGDEVDTILAADLNADHSLVAIGGPRKRVKVYRTADGSLAYDISKHTDWVTALQFSPNGERLVTADRSGNAYVWEGRTGRPVGELAGHTAMVTSVSWRSDSNLVATGSEDGTLRLWPGRGGAAVKQWGAHGGGVQSVVFTRDGRLATAGRDRQAKLWDGDGKQLAKLADTPDLALSVAITYDDSLAVVGDYHGGVQVIDLKESKRVAELEANPPTLAMRLDRARKQAAAERAQLKPLAELVAGVDQEIAGLRTVWGAYEKRLQEAKAELGAADEAHGQKLAEREAATTALAAADTAIATARKQREAAEQQLEALRAELVTVEAQPDDAAVAEQKVKMAEQVAEGEKAVAAANYLVESAIDARGAVEQRLATARAEVEVSQGELEERRKRLEGIEAEGRGLAPVEPVVEKRKELQSQIAALESKINATDSKAAAIEQELAEYQSAQQKLEAELAERKSSAEKLSTWLAQLNQEQEEKQQQAASMAAELARVETQLKQLQARHGQSQQAAKEAGEKVDAVATELAEVAQRSERVQQALEDIAAAKALQKQLSEGN